MDDTFTSRPAGESDVWSNCDLPCFAPTTTQKLWCFYHLGGISGTTTRQKYLPLLVTESGNTIFPFFCGRNERPFYQPRSFIARIQNRTLHQLQNQCTPCLCTQPDHSECGFSRVQCGVIYCCHCVLQCFMVGVTLFLCTGNPTSHIIRHRLTFVFDEQDHSN